MSDDEHKLQPNDPYNSMLEGAKNDRRPDFLNQSKSEGEGKENAERNKSKDGLKAAENIASTAVGAGMGGGGATEAVGSLGNLFKGKGKFKGDGGAGKKKKGKASKFSFAFVVIILAMIVPMLLSISNIPMILIGTIDMNLQRQGGFDEGEYLMQAQAEHIDQNALLNGAVARNHAADLAEHGIEVGQINIAGEFVKTNVYLADLDKVNMEVASLEDDYSLHHDEGELVVRFHDRIIKGSDFVATVESDPELYTAYSDALNLRARLYYSSEMQELDNENNISKSNTSNWQRTGDREQDWKNFQEMTASALDKDPSVNINGYEGQKSTSGEGNTEESTDGSEIDDESDSVENEEEPTGFDNSKGWNSSVLANIYNSSTNARLTVDKTLDQTTESGTTDVGSTGVDVSGFTLLDGYKYVTFYPPSAEENGGFEGLNGTDTINDNRLADGQVARDTRDGGALDYGDIIYIETTDDSNAEGSYAHGRFFIVADTGGETHGGDGWDIDVFVNESEQRLSSAPYGQFDNPKIYKVASGVSWEEYMNTYYNGTVKNDDTYYREVVDCSNGGVVEGDEGFTINVKCDANTVVDQVGSHVKGVEATDKGIQLIGAAISAVHPIKAANAFVYVEEILQRARIFGGTDKKSSIGIFASSNGGLDGGYPSGAPVDELMRAFDERGTIAYNDAVNGKNITVTESLFENANFVATISNGTYDESQFQSFQNDTALVATSMLNTGVINNTSLVTNGQKKSNIVLKTGGDESVDIDRLSKVTDALSFTFSEKPSKLFTSRVGAHWLSEGGSDYFSRIAQSILGYAPSDATAIQAYNRYIDERRAIAAAAERATKSPFDISSRNTFLGSIVYGISSTILANHHSFSGGISTTSVFGAVSSLADYSSKGFLNTVLADGPGTDYGDIIGKSCPTVNSIGVDGFLSCIPHGTVSPDYMDYTKEQWDSVLSEDDKKMYELLYKDRKSTVGVKDAEICERYKSEFSSTGENVVQSIFDFFSKMAGLYESCSGVDDSISLAGGFANSEANSENREKIKLLSAYSLFDRVNSYMNDAKSEMSKIKEEYYTKHPLDQSPAGRLARISGLSKSEAEIALNYADYLTMIANYQPSTRYAFGKSSVLIPITVEFVEDSEVKSSTYLAWFSKIEYSDVRNRSLVV